MHLLIQYYSFEEDELVLRSGKTFEKKGIVSSL